VCLLVRLLLCLLVCVFLCLFVGLLLSLLVRVLLCLLVRLLLCLLVRLLLCLLVRVLLCFLFPICVLFLFPSIHFFSPFFFYTTPLLVLSFLRFFIISFLSINIIYYLFTYLITQIFKNVLLWLRRYTLVRIIPRKHNTHENYVNFKQSHLSRKYHETSSSYFPFPRTPGSFSTAKTFSEQAEFRVNQITCKLWVGEFKADYPRVIQYIKRKVRDRKTDHPLCHITTCSESNLISNGKEVSSFEKKSRSVIW
jgi:hypothetical protein